MRCRLKNSTGVMLLNAKKEAEGKPQNTVQRSRKMKIA